MLLMFERGIRGGITQAVYRYAKANNKYMGEKFNPEERSSYLTYKDTNNLYGWAMSQQLPTREFYWIDPSEFTTPEKTEDERGYLLEVDFKYP